MRILTIFPQQCIHIYPRYHYMIKKWKHYQNIDILDVPNINNKSKSKLIKSLEKKELPQLTISEIGIADSLCDDIQDSLISCLDSKYFYKKFKGYNNATEIIEICKVSANRDFSHITAYWDSKKIQEILQQVRKQYGDIEYTRIHKLIIPKITNKLQKYEPIFRSNLMKDIIFRRVPRIFFMNFHDRKIPIKIYTEAEIEDINNRIENDDDYDDEDDEDDTDQL